MRILLRSVILGSLLVFTLPRLVELLRVANQLRTVSYERRREIVMGDFYKSIQAIQSRFPMSEPLALVPVTSAPEPEVFSNFYLYPRTTRLYVTWGAYRNAANDPKRPRIMVAVGDTLRVTTYESMRDDWLRRTPLVVRRFELSEPRTSFTVPLASSIDGPWPDIYVIEARLANDGAEPAEVRATFWPAGDVARVSIPAHTTQTFYDMLFQLFGTRRLGWMRLESSTPLRAAFYYANPGRNEAARLPLVERPGAPASVKPGRDTKLWLINTSDVAAASRVGEQTVVLAPHGFNISSISAMPTVEGDLYAFVSTRDRIGRTTFSWP